MMGELRGDPELNPMPSRCSMINSRARERHRKAPEIHTRVLPRLLDGNRAASLDLNSPRTGLWPLSIPRVLRESYRLSLW